MWNAQDKTMMPPGQMMRYDIARPDIGMPMKNAGQQSLGSNFSDQYVEDTFKKRKADVLNGVVGIRDAPSSLQTVNQIVNYAGNFVQTPPVFHQNFDGFQFSHVQTDSGGRHHQLVQENMPRTPPGTYMSYSVSSEALGMNSQKTTTGNSSAQSFPSKETPSISSAATIEIPRLPYSQHFTYKVVGQTEINSTQSATNNFGYVGDLLGNCLSHDEANNVHYSGGSVHLNPSVMPPEESIRPRTSVLANFENQGMGSHTQDNKNTESSSDHAKADHIMDVARSINALLCQTNRIVSSVNASGRGNTYLSANNEMGISNDHSTGVTSDAHQQEHTLSGCISSSAELQMKLGTANSASANAKNHDSLENSGSLGSQLNSSIDEESKATFGNFTQVNAGKIWDGTIQLNTSITISAVAFFKSGEKALEISWPQFIEVKGKVRLEAFEKFIQELHRSRSRGLMVTSICWKTGTSAAGLAGIKEVAKGYKDGQRVGFAHLFSGTDLYVCPCTETIITILAKYGFFKGMAAVVEDHDSLIGCVIWRRNQNSNKESDSKKMPLEKISNSPSESNLPNVSTTSTETKETEIKMPLTPKIDQTIASADQAPNAPVSHEKSASEGQAVTSNINLPSTAPPNTAFISADTLKLLQNFPAVASHLSRNNFFVSPLETFGGQISRTEAFISPAPAPNKPQVNTNDEQPTFSEAVHLPQDSQSGTNKRVDDDDLPEFDFYTACGAPTSNSSRPWFNQQGNDLAGQVVKESHLLDNTSLGKPVMKPEFVSVNPPVHAAPPLVHQGTLPPVKVVADTFERNAATRTVEVSHNPPVSRGNDVQHGNLYPKSAMWDDDDMPEWCPPDLDHVQPQPEAVPLQPRPNPVPRQHPHLDHWQQVRPPPPPPLPRMHPAPGLPSPIERQKQEELPLPRAPFHSNAAEHSRGLLGRHPTSYPPPSPTQPVPSAQFRSELARSPERVANSPRNLHRRFEMKPDRRPPEINRYENSRRHETSFDPRDRSPRRRPSETSRRRPTGFDVLPDHSRAASPRSSRRRPSLFDVKPNSYSGGRR